MVRRSAPSAGDGQTNTSHSDSDPSISRQFTPLSSADTSQSANSYGPPTDGDDPDVPLPSVETEPSQPPSLNTHGNSSLRSRTPSFSFTPPASDRNATPTLSFSPTYRPGPAPTHVIDNIIERIGNFRPSTESTRQMPAQAHTRAESQPRQSVSSVSPPGVHTPSASSNESSRPTTGRESTYSLPSQINSPNEIPTTRSSTVSDIANGMKNMAFGPGPSQSAPPPSTPHLHPGSPNPNRTSLGATGRPRSRSRRRSGSHVDQSPHNVADELPPQERFHEPAFQQSFSNAKHLMVNLADILASSSLHNEPDSTMRRLYRQASDLSRFQHPSTRTVGLVGDSGVGKSSLINSLLDCEGLARTSNSGAACTFVVTEYHYHDRDDFVIEPEYFTVNDVKDQFSELLQSYRLYHMLRHDPSDEAKAQRKALEDKAKLAQDTFQAAFRNRSMQNEQFLLDGPEGTVVETMLTWTKESCQPLIERTGSIQNRNVVADAEQCSRQLMELTSEPVSTNEPSVWPFIRKVKIYLKAHILSKGLILVDLPGLRDLNAARLKITERYVLKCNEIFAVCLIGRAITDAGVKGVFDLAKRAKLSNIGIICTKSDDIKASEAKKDWHGEPAEAIRTISAHIANDEKELEGLKGETQDLMLDIDADEEMGYEAKQELAMLHIEQEKAEKQLQNHQFELKSHLINTRNQKVTQSLLQTYQNQITSGTLKVFCVSNVEYWENRLKPKEKALPFLLLSGIPEVRRDCISIVAESQFRAATEYMKSTIPALLGSIELWVQSGSGSVAAERKEAIRNVLDGIERELDGLKPSAFRINAMSRSMEGRFKEQIFDVMGERKSQWSRSAKDASLKWLVWSSQSFIAFCRNYGDYYTPTVGGHCWNGEATKVMATHMEGRWQPFCQDIQAHQDETFSSIEDTFDRAIALSGAANIQSGSIETLAANLRHRQDLLLSSVEQLCDELKDGLLALRRDALSSIRTSIIGQLMEDSYQACNAAGGRGSDSVRKGIIQRGFGDENLFEKLRREFKKKFSTLARNHDSKIQEAIDSNLVFVQNDIDILRNENVALESERTPEFRRRVKNEVARVRREMVSTGMSINLSSLPKGSFWN